MRPHKVSLFTACDFREGRLRFQVNVANVLNNTRIIPVRLATGATAPDGFLVPGGRGVAYSRYDLVAPRELRFTTTWSY